MARDITEAEVLDEIRRWADSVPEREPGVVLRREMAEVIGCCGEALNVPIRRWIAEGKLKPCKVPYIDVVGRHTITWGYRIVGGE